MLPFLAAEKAPTLPGEMWCLGLAEQLRPPVSSRIGTNAWSVHGPTTGDDVSLDASAAIYRVTGELRQARVTPSHACILCRIGELDGPGAVAHEAGPTGFGQYRADTAAGVRCVVAAPSRHNPRPVTGSRPTRRTPCIWPGCCVSVRIAAPSCQATGASPLRSGFYVHR